MMSRAVVSLVLAAVACAPSADGPQPGPGGSGGKADGQGGPAYTLVVVPPGSRGDYQEVASVAELAASPETRFAAADPDIGGASEAIALPLLLPLVEIVATRALIGLGVAAGAAAVQQTGVVQELHVETPDLGPISLWLGAPLLTYLALTDRGALVPAGTVGERVLDRADALADERGLRFVESPDPADRAYASDGGVLSRYIVMLDRNALTGGALSTAQDLADEYGAPIEGDVVDDLFPAYVTLPMRREDARGLSRDPRVRYVEEDGVHTVGAAAAIAASGDEADARARSGAETDVDTRDCGDDAPPWNLDRIDQRDLPLDCRYVPGGTGQRVEVYVFDTGVIDTHPDLDQVLDGRDFVADGRRATDDCNGHGTAVASVVAGLRFGVAPDAEIVPVRVMDCAGKFQDSTVLRAAEWVIEEVARSGADAVVNFSGDSPRLSPHAGTVSQAVSRLVGHGITVVSAAGNDSCPAERTVPAALKAALTVGSTAPEDVLAPHSNRGSCVDLLAPGVGVPTAHPLPRVGDVIRDGTSFAAPHVAAAAAQYLEHHRGASPSEVRGALLASATRGRIAAVGADTPNRLLYVGLEP